MNDFPKVTQLDGSKAGIKPEPVLVALTDTGRGHCKEVSTSKQHFLPSRSPAPTSREKPGLIPAMDVCDPPREKPKYFFQWNPHNSHENTVQRRSLKKQQWTHVFHCCTNISLLPQFMSNYSHSIYKGVEWLLGQFMWL